MNMLIHYLWYAARTGIAYEILLIAKKITQTFLVSVILQFIHRNPEDPGLLPHVTESAYKNVIHKHNLWGLTSPTQTIYYSIVISLSNSCINSTPFCTLKHACKNIGLTLFFVVPVRCIVVGIKAFWIKHLQ